MADTNTGLNVSPKRNLIMPIGVQIGVLFFAISATFWVSNKYHESQSNDKNLAASISNLTNSVESLTLTVDNLRMRVEKGEKELIRLQMQAQ